jgi:hypothetical protein
MSMEARATLGVKAKNTNSVQGRTKAVVAGIAANPSLSSLASNSTALQTQSGVLDKAETVAGSRAKGTAAARNVQRKLQVGMLKTLLPLVQAIADQSGTLEGAVATIQAAGFVVALVAKRNKPILAAKQSQPGSPVVLEANATALGVSGKSCFFSWQSTVDGKTWVSLPSTTLATTSVANLTALTTYGFRVAVTTSSGVMGEWSQIVNFLVH